MCSRSWYFLVIKWFNKVFSDNNCVNPKENCKKILISFKPSWHDTVMKCEYFNTVVGDTLAIQTLATVCTARVPWNHLESQEIKITLKLKFRMNFSHLTTHDSEVSYEFHLALYNTGKLYQTVFRTKGYSDAKLDKSNLWHNWHQTVIWSWKLNQRDKLGYWVGPAQKLMCEETRIRRAVNSKTREF